MDCLEYMRGLPDKCFSLLIADVPYGIGADKPSVKNSRIRQDNGTYLSVEQKKYTQKDWDNLISNDFFDEFFRVSKNQIIFGANYYGLKGGMIVWDKMNGESDQYGCEIAYQSFNQRTDIVHYMWNGMMQGECCSMDVGKAFRQQGNKQLNEKRIHPCHKPIALYAWMFKHYAEKGGCIFDPMLGSGSSRIAAYKLGFDFCGCELDEEYFLAQEERFKKECLGIWKLKDGRTATELTLF